MDTITHGIVGALAGKAFFAGRDVPAQRTDGAWNGAQSSSTARVAILGCTVGSLFPDIDIFAGPVAHNPLAIMEWHRNITHSALVLPVWAVLLAAVSLPLSRWLRWERPSFPRLFLIYAVALASHVFLDVLTSFGTMVWSPLNYSRPAWDWLFILDLTFTAIALVPQLAAWCYREPGKFGRRVAAAWAALSAGGFGAYALAATAGYGFSIKVVGIVSAVFAVVLLMPAIHDAGFRWSRTSWCRTSMGILCIYLGLAAAMHKKALADVDEFAAAHHLPVENFAALPLPPTLTHWVGLIATPEGVWRTAFHEPGDVIEPTQLYPSARPDYFVEEAKKLRDVQVYLWFARFPIWNERKEGGRTVLEISDVRFYREEPLASSAGNPLLARLAGIRNRPAGFVFEIVFDGDGRVVSRGFKKPQE